MLTQPQIASPQVSTPFPTNTGSARFRVLDTLDEFRSVQNEWNDLVNKSDANCPFLRHEWLVFWWECFAANARLHVVLWEDESGLLGGAALMQTQRTICGVSVKTIEFLANGHSFRSDVVVEKHRRSQFLRHLCQHLLDLKSEWSLIWLRDIPDGSKTAESFSQAPDNFPVSLECPMVSPYCRLDGSWQDFWQSRKAHFRANLRRREKNLSKLGKITFHEGGGDGNYMHLLSTGLELEASGWKGMVGSAIRESTATSAFYAKIAKWAAANDWLRLYFLYLDNRAIAFDLALDYANRIYLLKIGYDESHAHHSPGQLLKMRALEMAYACGRSEYDFLGFDMAWKAEWANAFRTHVTVAVYGKGLLPRGFYLWQNRVLPKLRESRLIRKMILPRQSGSRRAD